LLFLLLPVLRTDKTGRPFSRIIPAQLNARFDLGVELHGEADGSVARTGTGLAAVAGVRCHLTEHFHLVASVGRELHNPLEAKAPTRSCLVVQ
jgi:hypothetical protein